MPAPLIDTRPWYEAALQPAPALPTLQGSIEADVQRRVRLQDVRTALVQGLADAFAFPRTHVNAGFPIRFQSPPSQPEVISRVG